MAKLISLFSYNERNEELLPYIVFQSHNQEGLESLSPDIMQITESIYVADLHIVKNYWQKMALKKGVDPTDLLAKVIDKFLPFCPLSVFCEHPFQGLVFFNHMKMQNGEGVFKSTSLFSKKVYQNMNWYPWFLAARQVNDGFEKRGCLKKERQNFQSQLLRFSRFTERVDLQEFSSLEQAHFYEIQRRFKAFIGLLWKWTFPSEQKEELEPSLFSFEHYQKLQGFPWVPFINQESPRIENWLEYPVSEWESLTEPLFCDLDKLSQNSGLREPFKALQLKWNITLFDMSQVSQSLCFKYPLCFQQEKKEDFPILMKQLHLAFDQFQTKLNKKSQELEMVNCPLIVGWTLEVEKRLVTTGKSQLLDPEEQLKHLHEDEIKQLSDKVKTPLLSFQIEESFIPGLDFNEGKNGESPSESSQGIHLPRPFYIFPQERALEPEKIKNSQFLDRTASDWWNRQDPRDSYRDCFLCELNDKSFVFAWRDYRGRWYHYGD